MWGKNSYGQIGDGTTENCDTPKKVLSNVSTVELNGNNGSTTAAITQNGDLYMWGKNDYGEVGAGTKADCLTPQKILSNVSYVEIFSDNTAAITQNGDLYMWGDNSDGEVGNGTTVNCLTPQKILSNVSYVSFDDSATTAAITRDGDLYMWGENRDGQVGVGTREDCPTPQKILSNVSNVSFSDFSVFNNTIAAITRDGDLYMWGENNYGTVGAGTNNCYYTPQKILSNVSEFSSDGSTTAAITQDSNLYMWGCNYGYTPKKITIVKSQNKQNTNTSTKSAPQKSMMKASAANTVPLSQASMLAATAESTEDNTTTEDENSSFIDTTKKEFTSLTPNETYNFYLMRSKTAENALGADNLLYITQAKADSEGKLTVKYDTAIEYDSAEYFIAAMSPIDISKAEVSVGSFTANGEEQFVEPTVTLNGETLVEGEDYKVRGDFSFKTAGNYTLKIVGIGLYAGVVEYNYDVNCDYNVTPLINNSKINATNVTKGNIVLFTGKASGGTKPYQYKFSAKHSTDSEYTVLKNFSTNKTTFEWKPRKVGTYTVKIEVKDNNGKTAVKTYELTVKPYFANETTISATTITKGDTITFAGKASGGTAPYQYMFKAKHSTDSSFTILKNFKTEGTTFVWRPTRAGTYKIETEVQDSQSRIAVNEFTITVKAPLANSSTISATTVTKGDTITFTGKASGGTAPYQYKLSAKHSTASSYIVLKDYSTTATKVWRPTKTGKYTVLTEVKDKTGKVVKKSFTLTVKAPLANSSTISATTITKGDTITFTGKASGGTSPYKYKLSAKHSTASSYTVLKDYSTTATKVWRPTKTGKYTVLTEVKDKMGKVVKKSFTLTVKAPLANSSTISATTITKGDTITFTGKASGGTAPYQYKLSAKHSTASSYIVLKDYSTTATKVWRPTKTGKYTVLTEVKDKTGKVVSKTYTLTVK